MKILVLQLCRMGDLLQTTPMLRGLRRRHPHAHITLVVLDAFASAPLPSSLYDRLVMLPCQTMVNDLNAANSEWPTALNRLREFVDDLSSEPFDLTLNLTHSDFGGLLCWLIPTGELRGGLVAPDRTRVVRGAWMTHFWSSQKSRTQGCFNLVDIHNKAAGVPCGESGLELDVPESAHAKVQEWLAARGATGRLVAVQLGASEERKRWPPERFAETIDALPPEMGGVVLVGSRSERYLADRARAHAKRALIDATGETSLPELAALLSRSRVLLTNDTGTMHVAAAVGTRVVDISTGPVFVHETGPYGEGHLAIESRLDCFPCIPGAHCTHFSCRDSFTPRDIAALAVYAVGEGPLPTPPNARILRGGYAPSGRMEYRPVWPAVERVEELRRAIADVWERTLPGSADLRSAKADDSLSGEFLNEAVFLKDLERRARAGAALSKKLTRARTAAEQSPIADALSSAMQSLVVTTQVESVGRPFIDYLQVTLECSDERDLVRLAQLYHAEFTATAERAGRLAARCGSPHMALA